MAKIVVALLLVLTLSTQAFADIKCKRCGYVKKHTHFPPYSKQLQDVIKVASEKTKISLTKNDKEIINKIIKRENAQGNLKARNGTCYGLGQGKPATYKGAGVPYNTTCPIEQVIMILKYVKSRYKTFDKAWQHHKLKKWY